MVLFLRRKLRCKPADLRCDLYRRDSFFFAFDRVARQKLPSEKINRFAHDVGDVLLYLGVSLSVDRRKKRTVLGLRHLDTADRFRRIFDV